MQPAQSRPKKLLDQVRDDIRVKYYSCRTAEMIYTYVSSGVVVACKSITFSQFLRVLNSRYPFSNPTVKRS